MSGDKFCVDQGTCHAACSCEATVERKAVTPTAIRFPQGSRVVGLVGGPWARRYGTVRASERDRVRVDWDSGTTGAIYSDDEIDRLIAPEKIIRQERPCNGCGHVHCFVDNSADLEDCPKCGGELYPIVTVIREDPEDPQPSWGETKAKFPVGCRVADGRAGGAGIVREHSSNETLFVQWPGEDHLAVVASFTNLRRLGSPPAAAPPVCPVEHPPHYTRLDPQPIDVIAAWGLNYNLGATLKYVARAGHKGSRLQDLQKAAKFLRHEIDREIAASNPKEPSTP